MRKRSDDGAIENPVRIPGRDCDREVHRDVAERQGFEPWLRYQRKHDFQSCAFSHSAISPNHLILFFAKMAYNRIAAWIIIADIPRQIKPF